MSRRYNDEVLTFTAEGKKATFVCYTRDNRSGFVHEAAMYVYGVSYPFAKGSAQYYNRTWETYRFQSVCGSIVRSLTLDEERRIKTEWMDERGYLRMSKKREAEYRADAPTSDYLEFLRTLSFCVNGAPRSWDSCTGERERAILQNPGDVRHVERTEAHDVYRIYNADGSAFCDYDKQTRAFVG